MPRRTISDPQYRPPKQHPAPERPKLYHQCHRCRAYVPDEVLEQRLMAEVVNGVPTGEKALYLVHRGDCPPRVADGVG